jgi:DNA-binding NarL/FixJ family response regulator
MLPSVAVKDSIPVFRHGICAALEDAGFRAVVPDDVLAWIERRSAALLLTLESDDDWDLLVDVHRSRPDAVVVALLPAPTPAMYRRVIGHGARGAAPRAAPVSAVIEVLQAALAGRMVLPSDVVLDLAHHAAGVEAQSMLTGEEVTWLRELARGVTVKDLGRDTGHSRRTMHRRLKQIYRRLGAAGRVEALVRAAELGALRADPDPPTRAAS